MTIVITIGGGSKPSSLSVRRTCRRRFVWVYISRLKPLHKALPVAFPPMLLFVKAGTPSRCSLFNLFLGVQRGLRPTTMNRPTLATPTGASSNDPPPCSNFLPPNTPSLRYSPQPQHAHHQREQRPRGHLQFRWVHLAPCGYLLGLQRTFLALKTPEKRAPYVAGCRGPRTAAIIEQGWKERDASSSSRTTPCPVYSTHSTPARCCKGVGAVLYTRTKYANAHGDVVTHPVSCKNAMGAVSSPFDCFLLPAQRGAITFALRMKADHLVPCVTLKTKGRGAEEVVYRSLPRRAEENLRKNKLAWMMCSAPTRGGLLFSDITSIQLFTPPTLTPSFTPSIGSAHFQTPSIFLTSLRLFMFAESLAGAPSGDDA
ncbi:hypothetical protein D9619_011168 [Psilocybe cf. subviscida]|uniref:Uncharacterized protein n=1 Tax=Psilocybe cf. subviscida TaxID=2480587 RepID=A0A8H5F551_9AGAR|nr:hypothetical protein D9619_011168 [Psilocybe cf. subviscida]